MPKKFTYELPDEDDANMTEKFWVVFEISWKQILTTVAFQLIVMTMFYFVGHIGDSIVMAGIGMGYIIMSACCTAFCYGMNGTLESKVS